MQSITAQWYSKLLLDEVLSAMEKSTEISESLLNLVVNVCGEHAIPAFAIVDNVGVKRVSSPSKKVVYEVTGSKDAKYVCLKDELYCNCPSFANNVILKGSHWICKHLLAVSFASALNKVVIANESNEYIERLLSF